MEKKASFLEFTSKIIKAEKLAPCQIINMDEMLLTFDCLPNRIVYKQGEKTIPNITSNNEKNLFTRVLSCTANSNKLKPLLIFKRKTIPKGDFPANLTVSANEKLCMYKEMRIHWMEEVYKKRKGTFFQPKSLLLFNSLRAHLKQFVKTKCTDKPCCNSKKPYKNFAAIGFSC